MAKRKNFRIYIETWDTKKFKFKWVGYGTEDIDTLMDVGIIDTDSLGWAMNDSKAFNKAMDFISQYPGEFSYSEFVEMYLSLTDEDIRIKA